MSPDGRLSPLQSLYCVAASCVLVQMGWGPATSLSSHLLHRSSLRPSGSVNVCGCSSVAAPQKGARGGGEGRISPTRCVSSMLLCHPLNLYCSSTGSISHIARTLVLLRLCHVCKQKQKKGNSDESQNSGSLAVEL